MIKNTFLLLFVSMIFFTTNSFAQRVIYDSLTANAGSNKSIIWNPSTYQNGYGHKIYGIDGGVKTDLRFASRHNTVTWTDIMTITSNGNVGIGTTSPADRLEIAGSVGSMKFSNSGARIIFTRNSANYIDAASSSGYLIFSTGGSMERMRIDSNGNVGIGTPILGAYKLAVAGTIGASRVKVTQTGWPDYVFREDYQLPSLAEVESYIKANQHLPGMPAAKEVEMEGLDLGEMNKKLLQKVEELMLYVIDMKKENDEIKKQNENQISIFLRRIEELESVNQLPLK